jgi:SAM-dependent methyltransferase
MGFFDFLGDTTRYGGRPTNIARLERRREFLVEPFSDQIKGARVLDLACHDGRWAYALAGAGAREVVGIEFRQQLIDQFADYPGGETRDRVTLIQGDIFEELPKLVAAGERFDVVTIFGIFYHIMDHYALLKLVKQLGAGLVVIDSEFLTRGAPLIRVWMEDTDSDFSAISPETGQAQAPIGVVSRAALEMLAGSLGYAVTWADWDSVPAADREGLAEYFRTSGPRLRGTCALRLEG